MRNTFVDFCQEVHFRGLYVTSVFLLKDSQFCLIEQGQYSRSFTNLSWLFLWGIVLM